MKPHYIAMAGLHGCMSNYSAAHDDYNSAVDDLVALHELGRNRAAQLRRDAYLELSLHRDGNEYAEVTECDCASPDDHSE